MNYLFYLFHALIFPFLIVPIQSLVFKVYTRELSINVLFSCGHTFFFDKFMVFLLIYHFLKNLFFDLLSFIFSVNFSFLINLLFSIHFKFNHLWPLWFSLNRNQNFFGDFPVSVVRIYLDFYEYFQTCKSEWILVFNRKEKIFKIRVERV